MHLLHPVLPLSLPYLKYAAMFLTIVEACQMKYHATLQLKELQEYRWSNLKVHKKLLAH